MRSAFFVFDLIGRNATSERKCNARSFIHPELNQRKEAIGLSSEKRVSGVPAGKASPKATGLITAILFQLV
jgi:hypothetical protein